MYVLAPEGLSRATRRYSASTCGKERCAGPFLRVGRILASVLTELRFGVCSETSLITGDGA